jgi:hypothetical protein
MRALVLALDSSGRVLGLVCLGAVVAVMHRIRRRMMGNGFKNACVHDARRQGEQPQQQHMCCQFVQLLPPTEHEIYRCKAHEGIDAV